MEAYKMKTKNIIIAFTFATLIFNVFNANATNYPSAVITPDSVDTRLGTLDFKDGAPSPSTVERLYDNLDFIHAVNTFLNAFQGASSYAMRQGFLSIGAQDNSVVIFSKLM